DELNVNKLIAFFCFTAALLLWLWSRGDHVVPVPDVETLPLPDTGKHALVILESEERGSLSADRLSVLNSAPLRQELYRRGYQLRIWDDDIRVTREDEWFVAAMKLPRESLPWMVIADGNKGVSQPLPSSVEEVLK